MPDVLDLVAYRDSVQATENRSTLSFFGQSFYRLNSATDLLPPVGSKYRDQVLRDFYHRDGNGMFQSTIANLWKDIAATPWEISGGRNKVRYYQDLLQNAQFGMGIGGWRSFILQFGVDYSTQDYGAFGEIIAPGDASKPVRTRVLGIAQLDAARCMPTLDPEYPVIYMALDGKYHYMHYTRVFRMVDMPGAEEGNLRIGKSALSRAISTVNGQIMVARYINERLSDLPPAGIMIANNISELSLKAALADFQADRRKDGEYIWANVMRLSSVDPAKPASIEFTSFASVPEHFDRAKYNEEDAIEMANAIGVDPQDIRPLSGSALGTGAQSKTLHAKGKGRAKKDILTAIERIINIHILPEDLEFRFKHRDGEEDMEIANTAKVWGEIAQNPNLSEMEARQLMANQIPAFKDVLEDENGEVRLPDDDVEPEQDVTFDDTTPETQGEAAQQQAGADNTTPASGPAGPVGKSVSGFGLAVAGLSVKAYAETRDDFLASMSDFITQALNQSMTKRRAGVVMRAILNRDGRKAMFDGLNDGGVLDESLSEDDQTKFNAWLVDQTGYVSDFLGTVYGGSAPNIDPNARAEIWARKSLDDVYRIGLLSADANGMYEFVGHDGEESCRDCQRLKHQIHRLKDWQRRGYDPRDNSNKLACGGWKCQHYLQRRKARARGRF